MNSTEWYNSINQVTGTQKIENIFNYIVEETYPFPSPIDSYYFSLRELLRVGSREVLDKNKTLGPLLLVGIISATENYFRDILANIIRICPSAQESASKQNINLGSVVWHGTSNFERSAFENTSFAGVDGITTACKNFIKFELKNNSLISGILEDFGHICEMRHGIVHSNSILSGKNAIKLGVPRKLGSVKLKVSYKEFQECASICTVLVASFNIELFKEMAKRWAIDWRRKISVDESNEKELLSRFGTCFYLILMPMRVMWR